MFSMDRHLVLRIDILQHCICIYCTYIVYTYKYKSLSTCPLLKVQYRNKSMGEGGGIWTVNSKQLVSLNTLKGTLIPITSYLSLWNFRKQNFAKIRFNLFSENFTKKESENFVKKSESKKAKLKFFFKDSSKKT